MNTKIDRILRPISLIIIAIMLALIAAVMIAMYVQNNAADYQQRWRLCMDRQGVYETNSVDDMVTMAEWCKQALG